MLNEENYTTLKSSFVDSERLFDKLNRVANQASELEYDESGLFYEEEEVLEVIRQKGGSCPQKDLYTEFDMSQAKVSLILNNLEERGLVRRFREGRENMIHLMED